MATPKKAPCKTFKPGGGIKAEICQICTFRRDVHVVIPGLEYEKPVVPEGQTHIREWTEVVVKKVPKQVEQPPVVVKEAPKPKPVEPPAPKPPPRQKAPEPEPEPEVEEEEEEQPQEEEPEGPFCPECKKQVEGKIVKFEGQMWHKACWVCSKCKGALPELFKFENNMPVCDNCKK